MSGSGLRKERGDEVWPQAAARGGTGGMGSLEGTGKSDKFGASECLVGNEGVILEYGLGFRRGEMGKENVVGGSTRPLRDGEESQTGA